MDRVETDGVWPDFVAPKRYPDAAPDWNDPALPDFRLIWATAREHGYSIGLHGSMKRDCDLIAAPWTDEAVGSAELIDHLCKALNARIVGGPEQKPLGRIAVSLQIDGWFKVIDLSICPRIAPPKAHDWFEYKGMTCCRSCGFIKNATSDTRPCKGSVKVEVRPAPVSAQKDKA